MANLNSLNSASKDLRRQLSNVSEFCQRRLYLSAAHTFCEGSQLRQNKRVKHAVIDRVRFQADFRMIVMMHTAV